MTIEDALDLLAVMQSDANDFDDMARIESLQRWLESIAIVIPFDCVRSPRAGS